MVAVVELAMPAASRAMAKVSAAAWPNSGPRVR